MHCPYCHPLAATSAFSGLGRSLVRWSTELACIDRWSTCGLREARALFIQNVSRRSLALLHALENTKWPEVPAWSEIEETTLYLATWQSSPKTGPMVLYKWHTAPPDGSCYNDSKDTLINSHECPGFTKFAAESHLVFSVGSICTLPYCVNTLIRPKSGLLHPEDVT